jgi:hypothetical protein
MPSSDTAVKGGKADKTVKADKIGKAEKSDRSGSVRPPKPSLKTPKPSAPALPAAAERGRLEPPHQTLQPALQGSDAIAAARDCALETAVLLDSIIHDLRTPLSAMSGWLEVLEAHFGEADGIVGRALLGLRRGVDSQTAGLSGLSDVLMKQRIDIPGQSECVLLERLSAALAELEANPEASLDPAVAARLAPFKTLDPAGSLTCRDAGSSLVEACVTLLRALSAAQDPADAPLALAATPDSILITLAGGHGDPTALRSLCVGLAGYPTRRPEIRAQAIWLARSLFRRCGIALQMSPAVGGGFHLLLSRAPSA